VDVRLKPHARFCNQVEHSSIGRAILDSDPYGSRTELRTHARHIADEQPLRSQTGDECGGVGRVLGQVTQQEVGAAGHNVPVLRFEPGT